MAEKSLTVNGQPEIKIDKKKREYLSVPYGDNKRQAIYGNTELWEVVQNGAVLKLTGVVSDNFFNVDSFTLDLPDAQPTKPKPMLTPATPEDKMTKDDWAEKNRTERQSIETQTTYNRAMDVYAAYISAGKTPENPRTKELIKRAIDWGISRLPETTEKIVKAIVEKVNEE